MLIQYVSLEEWFTLGQSLKEGTFIYTLTSQDEMQFAGTFIKQHEHGPEGAYLKMNNKPKMVRSSMAYFLKNKQ